MEAEIIATLLAGMFTGFVAMSGGYVYLHKAAQKTNKEQAECIKEYIKHIATLEEKYDRLKSDYEALLREHRELLKSQRA